MNVLQDLLMVSRMKRFTFGFFGAANPEHT